MKMMHRISPVGLWICVLLSVAAGAHGATLDDVIAEHCRARAACATLTATFEQTRIFTLFDEKETSGGMFFFARPGRICWRYEKPDSSSTVINGSEGWSVFPRIKQVQKFALEGSKTNKILSIVGFGACGAPLTDSFDIEMKKGKKGDYVLAMKPKDSDITPYFSLVELTLDRTDYLPRAIVLHEKSGDILRFEFSHVKTEAPLDMSIFELVVPRGYEVVEY